MKYDYLIENCRYPDFGARVFISGCIALSGGKIAGLFDSPEGIDAVRIDGRGKILSPGFIDIHMHEEDFTADGLRYYIADYMRNMGVTTCCGGNCGLIRQPVADFRAGIEKLGGSPVNYVLMSGYNRYRRAQGLGSYDKASDEQIEAAAACIRRDLDDGAMGISFGIEYDPAMTTEEILKLLDKFGDDNLLVPVHYRDDASNAIASIREMIKIGQKSGKRMQISHLSSCSASGQMDEALELIADAMSKDPKLDFDTYPYDAFSTSIGSTVFEDDCFEHLHITYNDILLTTGPHAGERCTKETFCEARREMPDAPAVCFAMDAREIAEAVASNLGMIASDGILSQGRGHPRAAGTFPRVLGKYVREEHALPLLDALEKITLRPARRLGLNDKGVVEVGKDADLTLFDPDTILDRADFIRNDLPPVGIDYVFLGGVPTVAHGKPTGALPGKFLPD
jgi:N-acyl-D-amino-acid deacylase